MRSVSKRFIAFTLAMLMTALLFAGCSGKNDSSQPAQPAQKTSENKVESWQKTSPGSGGTALPVVQNQVEYTFMTSEQGNMPFKDSFVVLPEILKRTNVKFNLIKVPDSNYKDKLNVVLASGDLPDFIAGVDVSTANNFGPKGLFLNLWDYIGSMPNLKKCFDTYPEFSDYKYSDKEFYQFLDQCAPDSDPQGFGYYTQIPAIRTDILKKLNLKTPTTYDELYNALVEMKKAYPNSYPWINNGKLESILQQMFLSWGGKIIDYDQNYAAYDRTAKKWGFGPEQPGFKEMIDYLAKCYKEGLLDKEFAVTNQQQWEERAINDKGFFNFTMWNNTDYITRRAQDKGNKDFNMVGFLPPVKSGQNNVVVRQLCNNTSAVSKKVKNPEPMLKAIDYWFYSRDGAMLANAGIEGVNYVWAEKDKVYKLIDPDLKNPSNETHKEKFGVRYGFMTGLRPDHFDLHNFVDNPDKDIYHQQYLLFKGHDTKPAPVKIFRNNDDIEQMKQIGVPIKDYVAQSLTKFVTGVSSMGSWDEFIQTSKKMGSDKMVDLLNKK